MKAYALARSSAVWIVLVMSIGASSLGAAARPASTVAPDAAEARLRAGAAAPATPRAKASAPDRVTTRPPVAARRGGPPDGLLLSGSKSIAGQLGSYCYGSTCLDIARWPPKPELPHLVVGTKSIQFQLRDSEEFVGWLASYSANGNDGRSEALGYGGESFDRDATRSAADRFTRATFDAPPAGDWVVWLNIGLNDGDLSYAWHVTVLPDTATGP